MVALKRRKSSLVKGLDGIKSIKKTSKAIKKGRINLRRRRKDLRKKKSTVDFLNTGCTILNLAGSQRGRNGGIARGRIIRIVGDGSSGKTLLALEIAAHAFYEVKRRISKFGKVKRVIVVYNNVEEKMDFDLVTMFGKQFVEGVEWISMPAAEKTGRDYARRLMNLEEGDFLLYIIDSWDQLKPEKEIERFEKTVEKDAEISDGYGVDKPAYATQTFFPAACRLMEKRDASGLKMGEKDATLIIISQTRQSIGGNLFVKKRVSGGAGFGFYTHQVLWLREIQKLKKTVKSHDVIYGVNIEAMFKRNKSALPFRRAEFTIYFDYGIDDIGSMYDWYFGGRRKDKTKIKDVSRDDIIKMGFSKTIPKKEGKTKTFKKSEFIDYIERNNLENELRRFIEREWHDVERKAGVRDKRKKRFPI